MANNEALLDEARLLIQCAQNDCYHEGNMWHKYEDFLTRSLISDPSRDSSEEEMSGLQTIDERDRAQDAVAEAAAILGCEEEWSNVHDHHLCLLELATERMAELSLLRGESNP